MGESFPANDNFSAQFRNKSNSSSYPSAPNFARDTAPKPAHNPQLFAPRANAHASNNSLSFAANFSPDWTESKDDSEVTSGDVDPEEPPAANSIEILHHTGFDLTRLAAGLDPELFRRVMDAKLPRTRFRMAWWFIISRSPRRVIMVDQLCKLGFNPPPWVAVDYQTQRPPFPAQWGNLAITLPAISYLFQCFIYFYREDIDFMARFAVDEVLFYRSLAHARAQLFDRRAIAEAIILSVDQWAGAPNFSSLFDSNLSRPDFARVSFNHYRIDNVPSSNYSNTKGCVGPAVFEKIAKDDFTGLAKKMAKKSRTKARQIPPTSYTRPGLLVSSLFPEIAVKAPSGVPYPEKSSLRFPSGPLKFPLYAPRLEFFATAHNFPATPTKERRSFYDYLTNLGRCPKYYCARFQSGPCTRSPCDYHHLCEWCAQPHNGNNCPYRPVNIALRN